MLQLFGHNINDTWTDIVLVYPHQRQTARTVGALRKKVPLPMLNIELKPADSEPEFSNQRLVGDWVTELPKMLAKLQNPPWCSYTARIGEQVVGLGGFKGPPDETGSVEIAYLTLQPEQRRGVANEVCAKLVVIAFESRASVVLAHTLPEDNPSTAVLRRQGFRLVGEVQDPEDGAVWRWSRGHVSD